jgi:lysophospholipase L1-like esterase
MQRMLLGRAAGVIVMSATLIGGTACGSDDAAPKDSPDASAGGSSAGGTSGAGGGGRGGSGAGGTSPGGTSGGGSGSGGAAGSGGSRGSGATAGSAGSGGSGGDPGEPGVRFVGRTDTTQAGAVRFAWSGSSVQFRFSGTDASVRMDDASGFFALLVDGQQRPTLTTTPGAKSYPVATGLPPGEHEVRLYRRAEGFEGLTSFLGVELGSGTLLPPPPAPARRMEIIGDSITCGYGNEGTLPCGFTPDTEDNYRAYGSVTARNLGADLVTLAWSGKGMIYNYGDDKNEPLPALYDRTLPQAAQPSWDFSRYQPHVVVINLGTNDFSTDGEPDEATFGNAYRSFLQHLRQKYPDAWILCLGPTGIGERTPFDYISRVVAGLKTAGDTKLEAHQLVFTTTGQGCDYHPTIETHASMAQALTTKLKSLLGW